MTNQTSNILLVLANAVANFNGSIAECQQNADFLLSDLAGVSVADLQVLGFGKLQSEAFFLSLKSLVEFVGKRYTAQTKAFINHIFSLLLDATNKYAAIQQPTNEPTATAKPRELVELDECLNAQIAAAHAVAVANNCSEFANVENAAAKAGVDLECYFDLFDDAGWELDFEPMQLEHLQDIYEATKERDGDDDYKNRAGELVERFAKFVYDKANAKNNEFLGLVSEYPAVVTDYILKNVCSQFGFELSIGLLRRQANAKVFTLTCNHPNLMNGFECLTEKGYHLLSDFNSFLHISRDFFRDILRKS